MLNVLTYPFLNNKLTNKKTKHYDEKILVIRIKSHTLTKIQMSAI